MSVELLPAIWPLPELLSWLLVIEPPWVAPPVEPVVPLPAAEPEFWLASLCGIADELLELELELLPVLPVDCGVVADCGLLFWSPPTVEPVLLLPVVEPVVPVDVWFWFWLMLGCVEPAPLLGVLALPVCAKPTADASSAVALTKSSFFISSPRLSVGYGGSGSRLRFTSVRRGLLQCTEFCAWRF